MKFITKNIFTAVFFSAFAILLGGALISCSNGSSSSDEDDDESSYRTKIYSNSVTFNAETPVQIVSAETLADLSIKSLTIKVINVNYSGSDAWWFTACSDSSWSNETKLEWQSGEGTNSLYLATITDATAIAAYKANGIYLAGMKGATANVSVFYVEGEAEESNDSGSRNNITFDGNPKELIIKSNLETKTISSITIKLSELTYSGSESSWWISIMTDTSWSNEIKISDKGIWEDSNNVTYIITDSTEINLYKENGIYIAGLEGLTGTVTVSYE